MSRFFDDYAYDYDRTAQDADDLYECVDDEHEYGEEVLDCDQDEWENSYNNISNELIED